MKDERSKFNVICGRCGTVLIQDGELDYCKHNKIEDIKNFYIYLDKKLNKKHKKPIFYGRSNKNLDR